MTPEVDADNPEAFVSRLCELARDESLEDKIRREWWSLRRLALNELLPSQSISFPIQIWKGEGPDFLMIFGKNQIGLEHVRAVWNAEAQAQSEREDKEILQLGPLLWRKDYKKRDGERAWGGESPGYGAAEAEIKQVELIEMCISRKVSKRSKIELRECWLVVDAAQDGVPDLDVQSIEDRLQASLSEGCKSFDVIWIDYGANDGIRRHGRAHGLPPVQGCE